MIDFQKYFEVTPESVRKLEHKGNNQLFEIQSQGKKYLLKAYSQMHMDNWARGKSEFNAVSYLWGRGFREIPRPIAFNEGDNVAIYSYEPGKTLEPGEVKEKDIANVANFLSRLHCLGNEEKKLFGPASSACLSLSEYSNVFDRRFARISAFSADTPLLEKASEFVNGKVHSLIQSLKSDISSRRAITDNLPLEEQVLTPADFGFHNVLVSSDKYTFVDFEYFGRDDPVRQILDFLHHDKSAGIKREMKELFVKTYREYAKPAAGFEERLKLVDPLIGMTWVLIYLNVLSNDYLKHLRFSQENIDGVVEERIAKAERKINELSFFN
jgi:thiamine kinase-like enzyme